MTRRRLASLISVTPLLAYGQEKKKGNQIGEATPAESITERHSGKAFQQVAATLDNVRKM